MVAKIGLLSKPDGELHVSTNLTVGESMSRQEIIINSLFCSDHESNQELKSWYEVKMNTSRDNTDRFRAHISIQPYGSLQPFAKTWMHSPKL